MTLEDLGYNRRIEEQRLEQGLGSFDIGRVISEHKDRFTVKSETGEFDAELIGNLRYSSESRSDLPAVGDWVAISEYDDSKALIHAVLPRKSKLERKAVGKVGQSQIIATNIDFGLIVQSVNRDFSVNRLERYLTICNAANIETIIILSKVDLVEENELHSILKQVKERINDIPLIAISNHSGLGIEEVKSALQKGKTYCLLGSSGVGKSSLINSLTGNHLMATGEISERIDRGQHVTSHRELIALDSGVLIDNPGMREVGITDNSAGIEMTFDEILSLSENCKFSDCSHTNEIGCAVLSALENGDVDAGSFANFQKMQKERTHYESTAQERKKKDKDLGKLIKGVKKQRKQNKY